MELVLSPLSVCVCVLCVAEAGPVSEGVSARSAPVAPAPGSAAARLPAAAHGRGPQLLPDQQLRPLLQHHAPLRRAAAHIE